MKSIVFLLPCPATVPVGGFKVVYEYANRLVKENYVVHIVYSSVLFPNELSFKEYIIRKLWYWRQKQAKSYLPDKWFCLDSRVHQHIVFSLEEKNIPRGDIYVATSWETAEYLMNYNGVTENGKFYLIQGYETWSCPDEERLLATWKAPLCKIVIAPWLKDIAVRLGQKAVLIENGFDFEGFGIDINIEDRKPDTVVMLYHEMEAKGTQDAFEALQVVKRYYPDLKVNIFGVFPQPVELASGYIYHRLPSKDELKRIYNESAIYVGPSHSEGWGLTVGEAMQCGCAVACTDNGGYAIMAHDEKTALVSPVRDPQALANNIIRLMQNNELRIRIAKGGYENIQQYTWERAYLKFKNVITN